MFWLRLSFWVAAIADFLVAIMVLIPDLPGDTYVISMGQMSAVAFSWGIMLIQAVRKPMERRWIAIPTLLVVFLLGVVSLTNMQMDLFPDINLPYAVVSTSYTGASPEEVENIVTRNIETAMATVSNVKTISSTSSDGSSMVILEFNQNTNMDSAMLDMREKLDMVSPYLPEDVSAPMLMV